MAIIRVPAVLVPWFIAVALVVWTAGPQRVPFFRLRSGRRRAARPRAGRPMPGPAVPERASRSFLRTLITSRAVRSPSTAMAAAGSKAAEIPCASTC